MRFLFGLCWIFLGPCLSAQPATESQSPWGAVGNDASGFLKDAGHVFSSPLRFDTNDWIVTGAVLGSTVACFAIDESVRSFAQKQQGTQDALMTLGRWYGSTEIAAAIAGTVYVGGLAFRDDDVRVTGLELLESLAFAGLVTSSVKVILGRSRPYTGEGAFTYRVFRWDESSWSLPSGHATVAFAMSSVLASRLSNDWASIGLYGLAGLTSVSRVYHDAHWVSDVVLGSAIGAFIGKAVVTLHKDSTQGSLNLNPQTNGITLTFVF